MLVNMVKNTNKEVVIVIVFPLAIVVAVFICSAFN